MNERFVYRLKFTKGEEVKFIAHLDVLRLFQRSIKRAGLPIAYSKGFNPHQLIAFASPLTLGATSEGEYVDIEFSKAVDCDEIRQRLNGVLPKGVSVLKAARLKENAGNAMAELAAADYEVDLNCGGDIADDLKNFLSQDSIIILKKTKTSAKPTDIKQDIISASAEGDKLKLRLAAGSRRNLKPELAAEAFCNFKGVAYDKYKIRAHRVNLLRMGENGLTELMAEVSED